MLIVSWIEFAVKAVSTVVVDSAVNAGGASRPHSQFDEPRNGSEEVSDSAAQQEWVSGAG